MLGFRCLSSVCQNLKEFVKMPMPESLKNLGVITFSPHELSKNARCSHELPTRPK
jgi:hypothetical protein